MVAHPRSVDHLVGIRSTQKLNPDVTPIELAIGRCKELCKGQVMRTKEDVVAAYEKAWDSFPMEEWKKYMERLPKVLKQIKMHKGSNRNTK